MSYSTGEKLHSANVWTKNGNKLRNLGKPQEEYLMQLSISCRRTPDPVFEEAHNDCLWDGEPKSSFQLLCRTVCNRQSLQLQLQVKSSSLIPVDSQVAKKRSRPSVAICCSIRHDIFPHNSREEQRDRWVAAVR